MEEIKVNFPEQGGDVWDITGPAGTHLTVGRDEEDSDDVRIDIYSPTSDFFGSIVIVKKTGEVVVKNKDGVEVASYIFD